MATKKHSNPAPTAAQSRSEEPAPTVAERLDAVDRALLHELSVLDVLRRALHEEDPGATDVALHVYNAITTIRCDIMTIAEGLEERVGAQEVA